MATSSYSPSRVPPVALGECHPTPTCTPVPVCPACGGLRCLCRPRFYAGQLLDEDDLNRLDRYIVEKSRLHNRYLFGWGVACGLEVSCAPCTTDKERGRVRVTPGYALSPCGDDIVVCQAETVDVCALISACAPAQDPCFAPSPSDDAAEAEEDWILAVCYRERSAREVVSLSGAGGARPRACDCGCGGGKGSTKNWSDCGCGSGDDHGATTAGAGAATLSAAARAAAAAQAATAVRPPTCEPTVICEDYAFRAYRAPKQKRGGVEEMSAIVRRFICCMAPFLEQVGSVDLQMEPAQQRKWLGDFKETIREFAQAEGLYDCEVADRLAAESIPSAADVDPKVYLDTWSTSAARLTILARFVLQKCLCAAILPPCPDPAYDDCVPLARITVRKRPCRVVRVCNVSARKFLITWQSVLYWLSWIPFLGSESRDPTRPTLRDRLDRMCCTTAVERYRDQAKESFRRFAMGKREKAPETAHERAGAPAPEQPAVAPRPEPSAFGTLLGAALKSEPESGDLTSVLLAAMGVPGPTGEPLMSDAELRNPMQFVMLRQLVAPLVRAVAPPIPGVTTPGAPTGGGVGEAELSAMREQLSALQETLKRHQATIDELKKARQKPKRRR